MMLYKRELGRVLKSLVFLLTVAGFILFVCSQGVLPPESTITKPEPGASAYGTKASNDPTLIMPEAAQSLFAQYSVNQYTTYPNGFIKYVKLSESDREKMDAIIAELSTSKKPSGGIESGAASQENAGITIRGDHLQASGDGNFQITTSEGEEPIHYVFDHSITWAQFSALMTQVDQLLGGGSDFSETWISHRFGQIPITYEDALSDYELILSEDQLTGAHARLFSDYAGIIMGLIPVFPAVFLCMQDSKKIAPMLYTRRISSPRFVFARYAALITAIMLPVFMVCAVLTGIHGLEYGAGNIDLFAYFKYALFWILPTAMASTAVGLFFTTLTATPVAIAVQLLWWFVDTMGGSSAYSFFGVRTMQLIPRHNALGNTSAYLHYLPSLIQNRIAIILLSLVFVVLTMAAFAMRRRGLVYVPISKRGKVQPKI